MSTSTTLHTEVSNLQPGDHLCCIYETDEEHRALLTPYLRQGLERNEKVVYIVDARTAETVLGFLREDGLDPQPFLDRGQLAIITVSDAYMREGAFIPDRMISFLRRETDRAVGEGYGALRATGEMSWALRRLPGSNHLIEYESKLNSFLPGSRCLALCQYDKRRFSPEILLQVLATHPIAVIGTEVYGNFHFVPPETFLAHDFPTAILGHWIEGLRIRRQMKTWEDALRESEDQFRAIFENSMDGILFTVPDGDILAANPAACEMLGRTEEEVCKGGRARVVDLSDPRLPVLLEERARTGMCHGELIFVRRDGTKFPVEISSRVYKDRNGNPRTSMVFRDITGRRRAEGDLRESEKKYRSLFEESFDGLFITSPEGRILDMNRKGVAMFGYDTCKEMQDLNLARDVYAYPPDRTRILSMVNATGTAEYEVVVKKKSGEKMTTYCSLTAVRDEKGSVACYRGIIRDITESKAMEVALRESEQKYRFLVAHADEAIFVAQDEVVKFPNPKALEMTGYSTEELAGVPFTDLIHPEDRGKVLERHIDRLRGGTPPGTYPFRVVKKAGEEIWAQLTAVLIDWEGRPGILCFLRDITKERNLEAQFRQAQKMEAIGTLAGGIAHDFNNLLTVTIGYCDLALARIGALDPLRHDLEEIRKASDRSAALTRQLLAFSRKQILVPKVINLGDVVADMDQMLRRLIGEDIDLVSVRGKDLWNVKADPGQIEQVIVNLVVNSRYAMPSGGMLTIEASNVVLDESYARGHEYVSPGSYVMLAVSDTGVGMDEGTLARIFDPFFTTKEMGSGLGLSTVYGIVKQSGGHINVYSEPGVGTTFKMYFPHVEETVTRISRAGALPLEELRGGETILVVEDEELVRQMVREILVQYGYFVLEARSGGEAVDLCSRREGTIHLMLTDVVMPGMNGLELSKRLAPMQPGMKVLFMSGYTANAIAHQGILEAGIAFVQKPFSMESLAYKVREVLSSGTATS